MLRSKRYVYFDNNDNISIWCRKKYGILNILTQDVIPIFFSMVSTYSDGKPELLDYATTMWDVIGAIYEHVFSVNFYQTTRRFLEFPSSATCLPVETTQNKFFLKSKK
jgi:hypothetical protein